MSSDIDQAPSFLLWEKLVRRDPDEPCIRGAILGALLWSTLCFVLAVVLFSPVGVSPSRAKTTWYGNVTVAFTDGSSRELVGTSTIPIVLTAPLVYARHLTPLAGRTWIEAARCLSGALPPVVPGAVVVCERATGTARATKAVVVQAAGGSGMVLLNPAGEGYGEELETETLRVPHVHLGERASTVLLSASTVPNQRVTLSGSTVTVYDADWVGFGFMVALGAFGLLAVGALAPSLLKANDVGAVVAVHVLPLERKLRITRHVARGRTVHKVVDLPSKVYIERRKVTYRRRGAVVNQTVILSLKLNDVPGEGNMSLHLYSVTGELTRNVRALAVLIGLSPERTTEVYAEVREKQKSSTWDATDPLIVLASTHHHNDDQCEDAEVSCEDQVEHDVECDYDLPDASGGGGSGGGCYGPHTLVRMADGTLREAHRIAVGDLLWAHPDGRAVRVVGRMTQAAGPRTLVALGPGLVISRPHRVLIDGRWMKPELAPGARLVERTLELHNFFVQGAAPVVAGGVVVSTLGGTCPGSHDARNPVHRVWASPQLLLALWRRERPDWPNVHLDAEDQWLMRVKSAAFCESLCE